MEKSTKVLIAVGSAVVVGSILGILFAPDKGTTTRKKIKDASDRLADTIRDRVQKGKDEIESIREGIKHSIESINEKVEDYI